MEKIPCPNIINGVRQQRHTFLVTSPYYEGYSYPAADASLLDIAAAIGSARRAHVPELDERVAFLQRAAGRLEYNDEDLERTVRMTGMPLQQVAGLFAEARQWLRQVPQVLAARFKGSEELKETIQPGVSKLLLPGKGFCYAVTPGNDPRSPALAAANLASLGIPFVLRASPKDSLAPNIIEALIAGGFDPHFASLVYIDNRAGEAAARHFKLLDAADSIWTFGPNKLVDEALRYEIRGKQAVLDLADLDLDGLDEAGLRYALQSRLHQGFRLEDAQHDHFEGKVVLRHNTGNCSAILQGAYSSLASSLLRAATSYPLGCTSTRSIALVNSPEATAEEILHDFAGRSVGDPLDPQTEVGYISAKTLDRLQSMVERNRARMELAGGERLSTIQARPLAILAHGDLPDFFEQEIPAYVLALRRCDHLESAIELLNRGTIPSQPRLAVSLLDIKPENIRTAVARIYAHTVLVDLPTTHVIPSIHEGNDYAQELSQHRLVVR